MTDTEAKKSTAPKATPKRLPFEQLAEQKSVPAWLLAAAVARHRWPAGRELTEAEFDQALTATRGIRIGAPKEK